MTVTAALTRQATPRFVEGFLDDRSRPGSEIRTDLRGRFDDDHFDVGRVTQDRSQAGWHFGADLDPRETAACNHHRIAGRRVREIGKRDEMRLQHGGFLELVDAEAVLAKPRNFGTEELTPRG